MSVAIPLLGGRPRRPRQSEDERRYAPGAGHTLGVGFAVLCFVIALASPDSIFDVPELRFLPPSDWPGWVLQLHWVLSFLVIAPFVVAVIVVRDLRMTSARGRRLSLIARTPSLAGIPPEHVEEDRALWDKRRAAAEMSWEYEKDRIGWLQGRLVLQALLLGDITTFALMCSVLLTTGGSGPGQGTVAKLACSIAAAAGTAFLSNFARIMLRVSGGDVTTRTFSWAIRSVILVIIADVGLYVLLDSETQNVMSSAQHALLLGVFVGATGDHAIQFMLDKATKWFNTGAVAAHKASPLLDIEGMTDAHVDRLEEEGIVSIHDLAFVPTARLFYSTAYSLQQICNWQDRALLQVYVGKKAAEALAERMHIRGAIDLRAFAHDLVFGTGESEAKDIRDSLGKVLGLDPGGLAALLESMAHDEAAMRIRYYWGAVIAPDRPQPADDKPQPSLGTPVQPVAAPPAQPSGAAPVPAAAAPPYPTFVIPLQPAINPPTQPAANGSTLPNPHDAGSQPHDGANGSA